MTELEIEAFLTIVKVGSVTKAAEQLFISQSALSRRLKTLESELGYPLLERKKGSRVMEITAAGSAFLPIAEQWRELWRESRLVVSKTIRPHLRIGAVDSVNTYIMLPIYRRLMDEEPEVNLKIVGNGSIEAYQLIERGALDLSLVAHPMFIKAVSAVPIFQEEMRLIGGKWLPQKATIHPSELDTRQEVYVDWNREFVQWHEFWFGSDAQPRIFVTKMAFLEQMLCDSGGWAIVPASAAGYMAERYGLQVRQLLESPADRVVYLLRNLACWSNPMTGRVLDYLMDRLRGIDGVTPLFTKGRTTGEP